MYAIRTDKINSQADNLLKVNSSTFSAPENNYRKSDKILIFWKTLVVEKMKYVMLSNLDTNKTLFSQNENSVTIFPK